MERWRSLWQGGSSTFQGKGSHGKVEIPVAEKEFPWQNGEVPMAEQRSPWQGQSSPDTVGVSVAGQGSLRQGRKPTLVAVGLRGRVRFAAAG